MTDRVGVRSYLDAGHGMVLELPSPSVVAELYRLPPNPVERSLQHDIPARLVHSVYEGHPVFVSVN